MLKKAMESADKYLAVVIVRVDPEASPGQAAIRKRLEGLDSVPRPDRGIKSGNDMPHCALLISGAIVQL
jgi:hypothetical protein